jgi:pimeloyl-ACP methyl ester carboxylesterase
MRQRFVSNGRVLAYLDSHASVAAQDRPAAAQDGSIAAQEPTVAAQEPTVAAQEPTAAAQDFSPAHTLVLLHAFPLNADMWQPQLDAVPAGWRFVAPDLRGFGESSVAAPGPTVAAQGFSPANEPAVAAQDFSPAKAFLEDYALDVLALLDHLGVPDAVIAGLSMGGYLALAICRIAAARVAGLVLANTKAEADPPEGRRAREQMMARVAQVGVTGLADEMLPRLLGETSRRERPEVVARVCGIAAATGVDGVRRAIAAMIQRPDSTALLATLACPALVIASDEDLITPPEQARAMSAHLRSAQVVVIPGAGHLSNLERPDAFNDALHRFLLSYATVDWRVNDSNSRRQASNR